MDSRCAALVLLCGLILVGYVAESSSRAIPKNTEKDIEKLKESLHLNGVTEKRFGSFFKRQLQEMEKDFKKEDQKLLVVEMLGVYLRIFQQINRTAAAQQERHAGQRAVEDVATVAERLHHHTTQLTNNTTLLTSSQLLRNIHTIREYKVDRWSPEEQLKVLNDYEVVYQKAFELMQ